MLFSILKTFVFYFILVFIIHKYISYLHHFQEEKDEIQQIMNKYISNDEKEMISQDLNNLVKDNI